MERRALQAVLALSSFVPLIAVSLGLFAGVGFFDVDGPPDLDNQYRYLSGVYLGVSATLWWSLPRVEERLVPLRLVALGIVVGGLGRIVSMTQVGWPADPAMLVGAGFEVLGVPALLAWQASYAARSIKA